VASLANIFKKKRPPLVGIDISASSVKVLELSKNGNQFRVERFAAEPVPQNAIVEHAITEVEQVAEVVQRAIKRSGTKLKNAAVAVASTHVITKLIKIPKGLGEHELNTQAEMEAEHYIPYPLDEVNLDYQVIPSGEEDSQEDDLLMAACRKEIIDDYISVLEDAGMKPTIIDIETYAMENACSLITEHMPGGGLEKTIAVLDIGSTTTNINVLHNNQSVYTRDHSFGGRQLTEEIQRRYGLSFEEAGLAKKQGGLPDNYQTDVLRPFMEALCQEGMRALQFFYSSTNFNSVDQILLAGGCAQIAGIDELVAARIGVPTLVANPFTSMSLASRIKPQLISNDAASLMITCGLAMRSFD
jgi:type IV pilus assembly protein PilM